jgi:hypothetical protein
MQRFEVSAQAIRRIREEFFAHLGIRFGQVLVEDDGRDANGALRPGELFARCDQVLCALERRVPRVHQPVLSPRAPRVRVDTDHREERQAAAEEREQFARGLYHRLIPQSPSLKPFRNRRVRDRR